MKFLKLFFGLIIFFILFAAVISPMSGCKKTEIEHDTTNHLVHDTTINNIHDTTIIVDTVYDLVHGLIGYYNFNGGNLNDSSGYGNNINLNTAIKTTDRFGRANNAYFFDGSVGYMRVPNSPSLNPSSITIMAIVEFAGFNDGICKVSQILMKGFQDQDNGTYGLRVVTGAGDCATVLETTQERLL